jgi:hypothetical protein
MNVFLTTLLTPKIHCVFQPLVLATWLHVGAPQKIHEK